MHSKLSMYMIVIYEQNNACMYPRSACMAVCTFSFCVWSCFIIQVCGTRQTSVDCACYQYHQVQHAGVSLMLVHTCKKLLLAGFSKCQIMHHACSLFCRPVLLLTISGWYFLHTWSVAAGCTTCIWLRRLAVTDRSKVKSGCKARVARAHIDRGTHV